MNSERFEPLSPFPISRRREVGVRQPISYVAPVGHAAAFESGREGWRQTALPTPTDAIANRSTAERETPRFVSRGTRAITWLRSRPSPPVLRRPHTWRNRAPERRLASREVDA